MARKKKEPTFKPGKGHGSARKGDKKFITQDGALFTYAEARGPYDPDIPGRKLVPTPKFIMWEKDYELQEKKKAHQELVVKTFAVSQQLKSLEEELKAGGLLDDTS